jgi:hypothetical protein
MSSNVLSAIIDADGTRLTKTLGQLERQLKVFEQGLKNAGSTESFNRLNRAADATRQRIAALKNIGNPLRPVSDGANRATGDLINLGRVVQDAPFGFLGIANNLNPLIEGFSRTTKASGGLGGAFKSLGKSMLGAGGLSLGISLLSTGLILFGDKIFGASKETKAFDEALTNLSKNVADDAAKLTTLVGLAQNSKAATEDRTKALKALNQEYGDTLKNMGIEQVSLGNLNVAYEKLIDNMLRQAVVKGLQEQISAAVQETAKTIITMQTAEEKRRIASEKAANKQKDQLTEEQKLRKNAEQELSFYNQTARDGNLALIQREQVLDGTFKAENTFESALAKVKGQLKEQLAPLLNLVTNFEDLGISLNKAGNKTDDLVSKAKAMAAFLDKNTQFSVTFEVDPADTPESTLAKAKEFLSKAQKFINTGLPPFKFKPVALLDFSVKFNEGIIKNIQEQAGKEATKTYKEAKKAFEEGVKELSTQNPNVIKLKVDVDVDAENLNKSISQSLAGAAEGIAESIGAAIGGNMPLLDGIVQTIANLIGSIGKALVQYGIIKKGLDKILTNPAIPGGVAIALGLSAIAVSAVLKNIAGFRAAGGPVSGGKSYVVGEKGPEIFVPNTGGNIIPNNRLQGMASAAAMSPAVALVGEFRIHGNDLLAFITQRQNSQNRNY